MESPLLRNRRRLWTKNFLLINKFKNRQGSLKLWTEFPRSRSLQTISCLSLKTDSLPPSSSCNHAPFTILTWKSKVNQHLLDLMALMKFQTPKCSTTTDKTKIYLIKKTSLTTRKNNLINKWRKLLPESKISSSRMRLNKELKRVKPLPFRNLEQLPY